MANRYWVGGSGNWSDAANHWSDSTNGTPGAGFLPTSADDVFFDANSNVGTGTFTVTVDGTSSSPSICNSFATGGVGGALDGAMTLSLGATAYLDVYGSLTLPATNFTWTGTSGARANFRSTASGKTITTNGVSLTTTVLYFDGVGGDWTLGSALTTTSNVFVLNGTFSTANYNVSCVSIQSTGTGTRTISLGSSAVTVTGTTCIVLSGSNLTFNAGTSTITSNNGGAVFNGGGYTFYNVSFTGNTSFTVPITGANTFNNLTITTPTSGNRRYTFDSNQTINGTLTAGAANTAVRRVTLRSDVVGTQRTLTVATLATLSDVDFGDIKAAGASAASPWSGTRIGDCGGNNNITFTAAGNKYWYSATGAGGNWSAAQWETSAGGTAPSVNNFPLPQDTVKFQDTGLNAGNTLTIDQAWNLPAIDGSGRTLTMTLASGVVSPSIFGDFNIPSVMTITGTGSWRFAKQGTQNVTTNGVTIPWPINVESGTGTVKLLDNLTISNTITLTGGTLDANGKNVSFTTFALGAGTKTLTMGAGTWTVSGATWNANANSSGLTVNRGTATITMTSASAKTFSGGGFTWPTLNQGGAGALTIAQSNTFANITNTVQPATITLTSGTTQTVDAFSIAGTVGNLITLNSSSAGNRAILSDASGTVSLSYVSIKDIAATGGAGWNAYTSNGNVDAGNNTGWVFDPAPSDVSVEFFMNLRSFTEPRRF